MVFKLVELKVAPLVGAWIEIKELAWRTHEEMVAPLVGAWIEIFTYVVNFASLRSLPSWERGLKFLY